MGDLLVYMFDPSNGLGGVRYEHFWRHPEHFDTLTSLWLARGATETGRRKLKSFAVNLVVRILRREAQKVTKLGLLRSSLDDTTIPALDDISLDPLSKSLHSTCPTLMTILTEACTSSSQRRRPSRVATWRKNKVRDTIHFQASLSFLHFQPGQITTISGLSLLREYKQWNNGFQTLSSLFLYSEGVPRQGISVISSYGCSTSYTKLIARPATAPKPIPLSNPSSLVTVRECSGGTLFNLSQACRKLIQDIASKEPVGFIYDNVNVRMKIGEQVIGKIGKFCIYAAKLIDLNLPVCV